MQSFRWWIVVSLLFVGCVLFEGKETVYLRSAQGRATQVEVEQRVGPPALTRSTEEGESVWVYEVREEQPGSRSRAPGTWCDEYVLTSHGPGIVRGWTQRPQLTGG